MKKLAVAVFAVFALLGAACGIESEDSTAEERVVRADDVLADDPADADALGAMPPELMLVTPPPAGCAAAVTCAGVKTCGAWSAFTQCAPQFSACDNSCIEAPSAFGRGDCQFTRSFIPQNRTRSCVMRATGQTCIETGYLARGGSCTPVP
jgi:hypothetical protein